MARKFSSITIILASLVVLMFAAFPLPAGAQDNPWDYIRISPESGHWNYPGMFVLEAERAVTVSWLIKCTDGGCGRPEETVTDFSFTAGQIIRVGWGHQCYRWQFDPIGRTGFIADAEPELCVADTPTPTATAPQVILTGTPTSTPDGEVTLTPTSTSTAPPGDVSTATPTAPAGDAPTATSTRRPRKTPAGGGAMLPLTGEAPPPSPISPALWPALAALLLIGFAGRTVWVGILQAQNGQSPVDLYSVLRTQAWKALILILVSLLILAFLVLPSLIRQAPPDFREPSGYSPPLPALVQEASPNFLDAPAEQAPALELQAGPQAPEVPSKELPEPSSPERKYFLTKATDREHQAEDWIDNSPVARLVIPALNVDARVHYVPFEDQTWNIQKLGKDIAWLGNSSSPGLGSNTVLAGHVTLREGGWGPFAYLYSLKPGDQVKVYTTWNVYTYTVREQEVVSAMNASVVDPSDESQVTLLTCTGWDENVQEYVDRRVVYAELVSVVPSLVSKEEKTPQR